MQPRTVEFRFLAEPTHVNFGGKVHGGMVMKWLDQAAYACAARWSGLYCVTVSVGTIRFRRPILVGHLVELEAKVVHTGSTSMHIFVQVRSGDSKSGELAETNHCIITFVARMSRAIPRKSRPGCLKPPKINFSNNTPLK